MSATLPRSERAQVHTTASIRSAVQATRLTKAYEVRPVLRGVSFVLAEGQTLALLGPNGAGKTTLLRILATLAKPSSGQAQVCGLDAAQEAHEIRRLVGYVGHQPHLYDELTCRENLVFFARMYGLRDGRERTEALLERVGLRARANDRVRTLSRGQTQRLALARGILHSPLLLLLDEPDTGLDEEASVLLGEILRERRDAGHTTILTTHHLERGLSMADRALVLVGGRVAHDGPASALPAEHVRSLYRGEAVVGA